MKARTRALLVAALLTALLLVACSTESDRTEKPSPDWSRALRLGHANLKQPVALAVDGAGHAHLAWCADGLFYAHLDAGARVLVNERLDVDTPKTRKPQLLVDGQDAVHLAWLSRQGDRQLLYHATLDPASGLRDVRLLSAENEDVSGYRMYRGPDGSLALIWASEIDDGTQGLVYASLSEPVTRTPLLSGAVDPFAVTDSAGTVHVAWLVERSLTARSVYYATLQEGPSGPELEPRAGIRLADFALSEGAITQGPAIGLDAETLYVMWSEQNLGGGLTPTAAFSYRVAFAPGEAVTTNPDGISLPPTDRPEYDRHASPYGLTVLAFLSAADLARGVDFCNAPAAVSTQESELPVALSVTTYSEAGGTIQIALGVMAGGEQLGYQLAGDTTGASLLPSLVADADRNLHLAWIDTAGFRDYRVHYATTAPRARRWLDRTTSDDILLGAGDLVFGVLSGVGLLPIAGIWVFPAAIWVVGFFIATGQEEMDRTPARIGFVVGVLIYVSMKVLLLPGLFSGTPLIQLVPRAWTTVVGIAVPVVILALALLSVLIYLRCAERATIFVAFLVFALVDVLLTLVLYAPGFFGQA